MLLDELVDLHDATLLSIQFEWKTGSCVADFSGVRGPRGRCRLRWTNVSDLHVPRTQEWGPSVSVLAASEPSPGRFELQLQSGDLITLRADGVTLESHH